MARKKDYITLLRKAVAAQNGNEVPPYLEIRIRDAALHREMRDKLYERINDAGLTIIEVGSMGQQTEKQNPLLPSLYQYEMMCANDDKLLGLTNAKAAKKVETTDDKPEDNPMAKLLSEMNS